MIGVGARRLTSVWGVEARALAAAFTFLTRIPVGRWISLDGDDVGRAALYFPVAGAGLGAAVGAVAQGLAGTLSPLLAAALAVALLAILTGALHLDGLADTADALGATTRQRSLAIMRDQAVGAYGAVAIGLDLLVVTVALATLASSHHALRYAVVAGAVSRATPPALAAALSYARAEHGSGAALTHASRRRAAVAALLALAVAGGIAGADGLIIAGAVAVATLAFGLVLRRWLGGATGDTFGAAIELSHILALVLAVGLVEHRALLA